MSLLLFFNGSGSQIFIPDLFPGGGRSTGRIYLKKDTADAIKIVKGIKNNPEQYFEEEEHKLSVLLRSQSLAREIAKESTKVSEAIVKIKERIRYLKELEDEEEEIFKRLKEEEDAIIALIKKFIA